METSVDLQGLEHYIEALKWRYLRNFIERNPRQNTISKYISTVDEFKDEARRYYSESEEALEVISEREFVEMMTLDGCFLIEFLVRSYMGQNIGELNTVNWNLPILRRDLLLLENQFPFPILCFLFDLSHIPDLVGAKEDGTDVTLMDLAVSFITQNEYETLPEASRPDTVHHLLHVYHASLLPMSADHSGDLLPISADHSGTDQPKRLKDRVPMEIPNATQLRECGVNFMTTKETRGSSFLEAKFYNKAGVMAIPKLPMRGDAIYHIHNLVAFEQSCPEVGTMFTSYAVLMDMLIDTPEDVAILKSSHILQGNIEDVAKIFNKLSNGVYLDYRKHYNNRLFRDVTEYCSVTRHKWRAQFMRDYFENPWAVISLVAAIVLLILTFLSTFYAMYVYYRPRS